MSQATDIHSLLDRARAFYVQGQFASSMELCQRVLAIDARQVDAIHLSGILSYQAGRFSESKSLFHRALEIYPDSAAILNSLGNVLLAERKHAEAVKAFNRAIEISPNQVDALSNLGIALSEMGRHDEAIACHRRAAEIKPSDVAVLTNLGKSLGDARRPDEAITVFNRLVELHPDSVDGHNNLAAMLMEVGRYGDAVRHCQRAHDLAPNSPYVLNNVGTMLLRQGRWKDAIAAFERTLELMPNHAEAHTKLGVTYLTIGQWERGWREYEWRFEINRYVGFRRKFAQPQWEGESLAGRTILLHAEQGFGDTIQFSRYAPILAAHGANVILECQPALLGLFKSSAYFSRITLVAAGQSLPPFDLHCPLMSVPRVLQTTPETIPQTGQYLTPLPADVARWSAKLNRVTGAAKKVGVVWAGNPLHRNDRSRSLPIEALAPLSNIANVKFVSLQKGDSPLISAAKHSSFAMIDFTSELTDFSETAALIANLDLVISVDTSVAHLAGAMGKPIWLLLPFVPDWRWMMSREDSPWYSTARLFRQTRDENWAGVVSEVGAALSKWTGHSDSLSRSADVAASFREAMAHYRASRLPAAELACRRALSLEPAHAESLHLLGIIALQSGHAAAAEELIRRAVARDPDNADFHSNLGNALISLGRIDDALASFQKAVVLNPNFVNAHFNLAGAFNMRGRRAEAIASYRRVLALSPIHASAHQILATLLVETGSISEAAALLKTAVQINPDFAEAWNSLGSVLFFQDAKHADEAIACCEKALALSPSMAHAHYNRASILQRSGRTKESIDGFERLLQIDPRHVDGLNNLGAAYLTLGQADRAKSCFEKVLEIQPRHAGAHGNLAAIFRKAGRLDEAADFFRRAIAISPELIDAHLGLGLTLIDQFRLDDAIACFQAAVARHPESPDLLNALGVSLAEKRRYEEAKTALVQSLHLRPDNPEVMLNLAGVLISTHELQAAESLLHRVLEINPGNAGVYNHLGLIAKSRGEFEAGIAHFRHSLKLNPEQPDVRANLGMSLMQLGDFTEGWREYHWRFKIQNAHNPPRTFSQPQWMGEDIAGKTLLLHAEQGLGDTLQFARFVPLAAARGAHLILECQPALLRLLKQSIAFPDLKFIAKGDQLPVFDYRCSLMDLPMALRTTLETIPGNVPFLTADSTDFANWAKFIDSKKRAFNVGLVWAGNPQHQNDRNRSLPIQALKPVLLGSPDIAFFSLLKRDKIPVEIPSEMELILPPRELSDFADTAGLIAHMDLIVTVDTAVAHLAGGMGKPVWILVPFISDWRWFVGRNDSPWYPSARLFRQKKSGDWSSVIEQLAKEMAKISIA